MAKRHASEIVQIRIDEKLKFLTTLAAAATGKSVTEYVSEALYASFEGVSLYKRPDEERTYGGNSTAWPELIDPEAEAVKREVLVLARQTELMWSESRITRMEILEVVAPHLLPAEDHQLLEFLRSLDEYKIIQGDKWKLDRKKIESQWAVIEARFAKVTDKKAASHA